jgi:hypothetical protein
MQALGFYLAKADGWHEENILSIRHVQLQRGTKSTQFSKAGAILKKDVNANATAIQNTNTEVTRINGVVTSQGTQLTSLTAALNDGLSKKANADAFNSLDVKVTVIDGRLTSTAQSVTNLTSTVGDHTTTLGIHGKVINGMEGSYSVSLDTNGVLTGFALVSKTDTNGRVTTAFGVDAQNFYIGAPAANKKPFIVTTVPQTINGITYPAGTWIDVAFIATATIGTAHIADLAVTTGKIADLAVTNAKIESIHANKITAGFIAAERIEGKSITADKLNVTNLSAISANLGTFTSTNTSGTTVISGSNIEVKDTSGRVRVRLGLW